MDLKILCLLFIVIVGCNIANARTVERENSSNKEKSVVRTLHRRSNEGSEQDAIMDSSQFDRLGKPLAPYKPMISNYKFKGITKKARKTKKSRKSIVKSIKQSLRGGNVTLVTSKKIKDDKNKSKTEDSNIRTVKADVNKNSAVGGGKTRSRRSIEDDQDEMIDSSLFDRQGNPKNPDKTQGVTKRTPDPKKPPESRIKLMEQTILHGGTTVVTGKEIKDNKAKTSPAAGSSKKN